MTPPGVAPDVVVIGGGIVGAATAYELCRLGARVSLVDERHPGRATDAGAGILSPETALHPDERWRDLAVAAGAHYRQLVAELDDAGAGEGDGDGTGFAECSLLRVAVREGEVDVWEQEATRARARHPGLLEDLDAAEARRMFPPLGPVLRVLHNPSAARVDGRVLEAALLRAARRAGLDVRHERVTSLDADHDGGGGGRGGEQRVRRVRWTSGGLDCGAVVICGGAWSPSITGSLGAALPVTPLKGQIVHLRAAEPDTGSWPIVQPILGYYVVSWPEGRVVCGGTLEADAGFDVRPTVRGLRELLRECVLVAPGLADAGFTEVRVGLRPVTPDGAPVLGHLPGWSNVHVATGHGTDGLLLGPLSGRLVALEVLGHPLPISLAPFGADRFDAVRGEA